MGVSNLVNFRRIQREVVSTQLTTGGWGKEIQYFQPVINLIFFPPVEDNFVST